jgi:hypothetical protein
MAKIKHIFTIPKKGNLTMTIGTRMIRIRRKKRKRPRQRQMAKTKKSWEMKRH